MKTIILLCVITLVFGQFDDSLNDDSFDEDREERGKGFQGFMRHGFGGWDRRGGHGGRGGRGGGPFGWLYRDLDSAQRQKLDEIFDKKETATKGEFKKELEDFVTTLPAETQKRFQEQKEEWEKCKSDNDDRAKGLNAESKTLYDQLKKTAEDESLTRKQAREEVEKLWVGSDGKIKDEFRKFRVDVPGYFGGRGGHGGRGGGGWGRGGRH